MSPYKCACGRHSSGADHESAIADAEELSRRTLQAAALRSLFPRNAERRRFLRSRRGT
jgi:nitrate/nitrite transport system substrate-binding protein